MKNNRTIDGTDLRILSLLQKDARIANSSIARIVRLAPSAIFERLKKLEARGVIRGYEPRLDPTALSASLVAFIFVRAEEQVGACETGNLLGQIPEVQEVHSIAGEDCYLVKVRVAGTDALHALLRDRIGTIRTVRSTRTTIVLNTLKETAQFPLPNPAETASD